MYVRSRLSLGFMLHWPLHTHRGEVSCSYEYKRDESTLFSLFYKKRDKLIDTCVCGGIQSAKHVLMKIWMKGIWKAKDGNIWQVTFFVC